MYRLYTFTICFMMFTAMQYMLITLEDVNKECVLSMQYVQSCYTEVLFQGSFEGEQQNYFFYGALWW